MPDLDITVIIDKKKTTTEEDQARKLKEVWPTLLPDDDDYCPETEIIFFDAYTCPDPDNEGDWLDVSDVSNSSSAKVVELSSWSGELRDRDPFISCPKNVTIKVYGNEDSRVDPAVIAREFGEDNQDRWKRKPMINVPNDGSFLESAGRAKIGGNIFDGSDFNSSYSKFLIRCELRVSGTDEPIMAADPGMEQSGDLRQLKLKYQDAEENHPLTYRTTLYGRRLGIKVTEYSKSVGHYVDGEGNYTYDWISGIYFCPFDTTDTDSFKITSEPSFGGEEVLTSHMITEGKWEVYLVPRRWAFRVRYRQQQVLQDVERIQKVFDNVNCDCNWWLVECWKNVSNQAIDVEYDESTSCPGEATTPGTVKSRPVQVDWYEALWWGRWPCNWAANHYGTDATAGPVEAYPTATCQFVSSFTGTTIATPELLWRDTVTTARSNFIEAGGIQDESERIFCGGTSGDLHIVGADPSLAVRLRGPQEQSARVSANCIKHKMSLSPIETKSTNSYHYVSEFFAHDSEDIGVKALWMVIENSGFWEDVIAPLRDEAKDPNNNKAASMIDCIPFGVGISPSKQEDLVGIVKLRNRVFFIWRRTDEEIDDYSIGDVSEKMGFETFSSESFSSEGRWGIWELGQSFTSKVWDGEWVDQYRVVSGRKIDAVGFHPENPAEGTSGPEPLHQCSTTFKEVTGWDVSEQEPAVVLDAPVYVMVSKEHAFDDISWSDDTIWIGGTLNSRRRCARYFEDFDPVDAATRNSY
jgi:hypothetical protein